MQIQQIRISCLEFWYRKIEIEKYSEVRQYLFTDVPCGNNDKQHILQYVFFSVDCRDANRMTPQDFYKNNKLLSLNRHFSY